MRRNSLLVFVVGIAVVLLVVVLRDDPGAPAAGPVVEKAPALAEVVDPKGRLALPLPAGAIVQWDHAGAKILTVSGGGLEVEAFDSTGPPVRALQLYELATQNASKRGDTVLDGDRREGRAGMAEVRLKFRTKDGRDGDSRYLLRGTRYVQVRAVGPGSEAVIEGLRLP